MNTIKERAQKIWDALEQQQHDPLIELVNIAKNTKDEKLKADINRDLLNYIAPKLKAVDINADVNLQGEVKVVSFKDVTPEDVDEHHRK